jgi:ATP-dependent DNA helicase RecG
MSELGEDRRIDYKRVDYPRRERIDFGEMAKYYSAYSNTPDGGVLVFGATSDGKPLGVSSVPIAQLNRLETFHLTMCPMAKPEPKRFAVVTDDRQDFCIAVYVPYIGRLVETNKGEAWIRYGDSIHKMSDEEKRDFRATRQETGFELEKDLAYSYPEDFNMTTIQDFCDRFRQRENRLDWTNADVLIDRNLVGREGGILVPLNTLVLLAAKNPRRSIPGCRVRIQRFAETAEGSGTNYNPIVDKISEGNIVDIIREAGGLISDTIFQVTYLNKDGKFVTTDEYPRWAWFEAMVNACVHRSYSFSGSEITVKFFLPVQVGQVR